MSKTASLKKQIEWYVGIANEIIGPLRFETIQTLLRLRRLGGLDYVWRSGLESWQRLMELSEFSQDLTEKPTIATPSPLEEGTKNRPSYSKTSGKTGVRRHERVSISGKIITKDYGDFEIENLSESGLLLKGHPSNPLPIPIGTHIEFQLMSHALSREVKMSGSVIRHMIGASFSGFGIEFLEVKPEDLDLIQELIRSHVFMT